MKRKTLTALGVLLIVSGLVLAGYPGWLWVEGRLEQARLAREFEETDPTIIMPDDFFPGTGERPQLEKPDMPTYTDFPNTQIVIPKLDLEAYVVKVTDLNAFAQRRNHPPGYFPHSAYPGEVGNVAIAGHRTGPAGYFQNLDKLKEGDLIILRTQGFDYQYTVERVFITHKYDWQVVENTDYSALTLTTCQAVGRDGSAKRLIVRAKFLDFSVNNTN